MIQLSVYLTKIHIFVTGHPNLRTNVNNQKTEKLRKHNQCPRAS